MREVHPRRYSGQMTHDDNWFENQYRPSLTVKNADAILAEWVARSTATRTRQPFISDIAYGPHPRETFDFYRVEDARAVVVFIHGGYWQELSKSETSFVVDDMIEQGVCVALINYPLCPEVTVLDIRSSITKAITHLWHHTLDDREKQNIIVSGHSAGAYLAADLLTVAWPDHDLPQNPFSAVIALSGIYDVEPLMHTTINDALRLDTRQAMALNLLSRKPQTKASLVIGIGDQEPQEFHRQAHDLAKSWSALNPKLKALGGTHHFSIVDHLAVLASPYFTK